MKNKADFRSHQGKKYNHVFCHFINLRFEKNFADHLIVVNSGFVILEKAQYLKVTPNYTEEN